MWCPILTQDFIEGINEVVENYLWNGKKPKISLEYLSLKKQDGGLNLLNLVNKDYSLKIQWVKAYYDDSEIETLANYLMNNKFGAYLWHLNLKEEHTHTVVEKAFG